MVLLSKLRMGDQFHIGTRYFAVEGQRGLDEISVKALEPLNNTGSWCYGAMELFPSQTLVDTGRDIPLDKIETREGFDIPTSVDDPRIARVEPARIRITATQKIVALQLMWSLAYPGTEIPEGLGSLEGVIPSKLSKKEISIYIHGALEQTKHKYLLALNGVWSKGALEEKARAEGVLRGLEAFDKKTRKRLEGVIKFLSD